MTTHQTAWDGLLKQLPLGWLLQPETSSAAVLPADGLRGLTPLPWWAAGHYGGSLRREILQLRLDPRPVRIRPLLPGLIARLQILASQVVLMPIPSWKSRANPLPMLLATQLGRQLGWAVDSSALIRSRPVLGQHRLDRKLRWDNQRDAFHCPVSPRLRRLPRGQRTVLLVDDILTTGATACAAAAALRQGGWDVAGLACLARTLHQTRGADRDLRSGSCQDASVTTSRDSSVGRAGD
jgi:predicted amidophosphoribosyltransferase